MTVLDLIKSSLRLINALASGEVPGAAMQQDAKDALNMMLDTWQNEGFLTLQEEQSFAVVAGTGSYSIGPLQTWVGNKPLKIESAVLRDSSSKDCPLKQYRYSDFIQIYDKTSRAKPTVFAYIPGNTTGTVYLNPVPEQNYTIKLLSNKAFTQYTSVSTTISLPAGYTEAVKYNLAVRLMPEYGTDVNPLVPKQAGEMLVALEKTNIKKPPRLQYERTFSRAGAYDIANDRVL